MVSGKAFLVSETKNGDANWQIISKEFKDPEIGEVLIKVSYSSLNYKDCLSAHIHKGISRNYPHTPGIDAAGVILRTNDSRFEAGEEVIITGYDLGMNVAGGFAEYLTVPADWILKKPRDLSLREAMIFGTAGFTAMLSIIKMSKVTDLSAGNILVTGATGGVGSLATLLLKESGFKVICLSRTDNEFIKKLAPDGLILTESFVAASQKALQTREYIAAIDNLGGDVTAEILKRIDNNGAVALCGNVLGVNITGSIYPFILRAVSLLGISSANTEMVEREKVWQNLARSCILKNAEFLVSEISLGELPDVLKQMKQGFHQGRTIINLQQVS